MLLQLTYASRPFGYDAMMLTGILFDARRCNARDGITGALICRDDLFLQLLEGPEAAVEATYARICADDRHIEVRRLTRRMIADDARMFGGWAMRDDPAASWVWSRAEVDAGKPEQASEDEVLGMFRRLPAVDVPG
ncbi:BLUF domain-containing protein [Tabrizicola sp.]|uniref:BLUF domain-containing protein n=1 Tax=Tabrizicola sp. TaxID=2005166 RepID=UPI003F418AAD